MPRALRLHVPAATALREGRSAMRGDRSRKTLDHCRGLHSVRCVGFWFSVIEQACIPRHGACMGRTSGHHTEHCLLPASVARRFNRNESSLRHGVKTHFGGS